MCTFCSILRGDLGAEIVFEDGATAAFLDHRPLFPGHCLLVPRTHLATLAELSPELAGSLFANAQMLAGCVERALEAQGTFIALNDKISQSMPHLHIHIVPRRRKDGLRGFFWPRNGYADDGEPARVAAAVRAEVANAGDGSR